MELYTRTYPGIAKQLAGYFGIPLPVLPHSTLNELFDINASATLGANEMPRVAYIAIGNGGHKSKPGVNNFPLLDNYIHRSRDTGLYNQLPFVMRALDNDLTDIERERYGLHKIIKDDDGNDWHAYYLMRFDRSGLQIKIQDRVVDDQQQTVITDFEAHSDDLKPTPMDLDNTGINSVKGKYISATVSVKIEFTAFDAEELLNVCRILYKSEYYAIVSELAFVSGVDRTASTPDGQGGTITMEEVICAQIANHIPALQPVFSQRNGFDIVSEVGGIEPLLNIENIVGP
jgi:hypothetical protein